MLAITYHADVIRGEAFAVNEVGDQVGLILKATVEIGSVDAIEQAVEPKVLDNALGKDGRLGRAQKQPRAGCFSAR